MFLGNTKSLIMKTLQLNTIHSENLYFMFSCRVFIIKDFFPQNMIFFSLNFNKQYPRVLILKTQKGKKKHEFLLPNFISKSCCEQISFLSLIQYAVKVYTIFQIVVHKSRVFILFHRLLFLFSFCFFYIRSEPAVRKKTKLF